jgi:trimethylamine---corrinoid protein Co-methyltransferase
MSKKGFTRNIKPIEILNEEQLQSIHSNTLNVLESTGIRFESEKILKFFQKNGCNVDFLENRVRFPSYIVEECIRKCPSSFTMKSREHSNSLIIGGNNHCFSDMPGNWTIDLDTWKTRPATRKENKEAVIVLDALENFHIFCAYTPYFEVDGVSAEMAIPESYAAKLRNSTKVSWEGSQKECEIYIIEMAKATGQDVMGVGLPSAPLSYYEDACDSLIRYINAGFPVNIACGVMMGGTSPASIAGSLVSFNAEVMGGLILAQLTKPGSKIVVEDSVLPMNMQNGHPVFGDITTALHITAFAQLYRKYEIPTFADSGWTNSKTIDFQDGYERSLTALTVALSGVNVNNLYGGVYGELAYHPVQSILDDDIAGMIGRYLQGIDINSETLAADLIQSTGPIPGSFLATSHTRNYFRKERFFTKAADMMTYPEWMGMGKKGCIDLATERMKNILETHKVVPLPEDQDREIEKILESARKHYNGSV